MTNVAVTPNPRFQPFNLTTFTYRYISTVQEAARKKDYAALEDSIKNARKAGVPDKMMSEGLKVLSDYHGKSSKKSSLAKDFRKAFEDRDIERVDELIDLAIETKAKCEVNHVLDTESIFPIDFHD
jgi:hypothetical protein